MDKSETSFAPQWMKNSGGHSSTQNQVFPASSVVRSVDHPVSKYTRNKSSVNSDHNIKRTSVSDRTTSSYFRRSISTNGSCHTQSYNGFTRSHPESVRGNDVNDYHYKDRLILGDHRHLDLLGPLESIYPSSFERSTLRRSQSVLNRKQSETWPRKEADEFANANRSIKSSYISLAGTSVVGNVEKNTFKLDFPALGGEERRGRLEIKRVTSPGPSTGIGSSPVASSTVTGFEGWTSALAEVPIGARNNGIGSTSTKQALTASSESAPAAMTSGLNMAETIAQGPSRAHTPPLATVGNQKLEELAIKQSRQLIPVLPSSTKNMGVNPSEKSKLKSGHQQYPPNSINQSRSGQTRSDSLKTFNESRLQVLKPSRNLNGVSSMSKDCSIPSNGSKIANSPIGVTPLATLLRTSSNNSSFLSAERNQAQPPLRLASDKKPTSQGQSRTDFFNTIKESSVNSPSSLMFPGSPVPSSQSESSDDLVPESTDASTTKLSDGNSLGMYSADMSIDSSNLIKKNSNVNNGSQVYSDDGSNHTRSDVILYPEEAEAAFLRSLGWEESSGAEEPLTEEEIKAFIVEYKKLRPSSKFINQC